LVFVSVNSWRLEKAVASGRNSLRDRSRAERVAPRVRSIVPIASATAEIDRRGAKQAGFIAPIGKISNKHFDLLANNLSR